MSFLKLLQSHLESPFLTAFAYGSGVFKQSNSLPCRNALNNNKMIDYLVVVRDDELKSWHCRNWLKNPKDYPILGRFAATRTNLFENFVYYVPDVETLDGKRIKYGILGRQVLLRDLYTWNSMFLAGRLHKPTIQLLDAPEFTAAINYNLDSALKVALLQNPNKLDFFSVLKRIVALSYTNDPRLLLAESPRKVENIVTGQFKELEAMYLERFQKLSKRYSGCFDDPLVRIELINNLPSNLKAELLHESSSLWHVALSPVNSVITEAIGRIVRRSAMKQMALGVISSPPLKGINYIVSKMKKRWNI